MLVKVYLVSLRRRPAPPKIGSRDRAGGARGFVGLLTIRERGEHAN